MLGFVRTTHRCRNSSREPLQKMQQLTSQKMQLLISYRFLSVNNKNAAINITGSVDLSLTQTHQRAAPSVARRCQNSIETIIWREKH